MNLIDVGLHHLVLLLHDGACRKGGALVALLSGLSDAFESLILRADVVLEGVHLLSCPCHHVPHLELRMSELLAFTSRIWLPLRVGLKALVLVTLLLACWSARQSGGGPVPRYLALCLVVESQALAIALLDSVLTD